MLKVTMVNKGININCSKIHVSVLFVDCYGDKQNYKLL